MLNSNTTSALSGISLSPFAMLIVISDGPAVSVLKPVAKSFWGYGGVVQAPDGAI